MTEILFDETKRHDFVLLFDVQDGNPNGDPDAGNLPRVDPETMHGIVTDVCLKRKLRNFVDATRGAEERFKIYVQNKEALNTLHEEAYKENKLTSTGSKQKRQDVETVRQWMCNRYYDVRTFGAVMTTGRNCGQVRGPVQMTFARSVDPVVPQEIAITRIAITKPEDMEFTAADDEKNQKERGGKVTEMGRKAIIPYGLYRSFGFFSPKLAKQSGFNSEDLRMFWDAVQHMFDLDRSASRGLMALRALYVFNHESEYGNVPAEQLFSLVMDRVQKRAGVSAARSIADYNALPAVADLQGLIPINVRVSSLVPLAIARAASV